MNAAETSASRAIAPWTSLTVVSRSSTTLEIDTFIRDVSTTSTNIAAASSSASRLLPSASGMVCDPPPRRKLPQFRRHDHGEAGADADQPLVAGQLDRVQDALQEPERRCQD